MSGQSLLLGYDAWIFRFSTSRRQENFAWFSVRVISPALILNDLRSFWYRFTQAQEFGACDIDMGDFYFQLAKPIFKRNSTFFVT